MKHFKLIFNRFIQGEGVTIPIDIDDSGMRARGSKVVSEAELITNSLEKVISANERLAKVSSDKRIGSTKLADASITRFNAAKGLLQDRMNAKTTNPNTKVQIASMLGSVKSLGLDNLKTEQAGSLDKTGISKITSMGDKMSKLGIKAAAEEIKYYNKVAKDQLTILQQESKEAVKTEKSMKSLGNGMNSVANGAGKAGKEVSNFTKITKSLAGAAVRWRILYGAFSRVWNVLAGTVEKAAAYEEALNLYTVALGEYADKGHEWATRISSALYLDPKQLMQYTGAFYNLVEGLGVGSEAAYKMATNLTQLSYDMSSYLNIDVESAHDKLQSAITGQSRAVASAGIAMQQASLQELAYSLGIDKTVSSMTQAEKTYLRYIQIMRSTTNMQTDLARTIITPENALRVIRQQFELLGRAIGQVFIPIIMSAIPYVMALTQALSKLATWLGGKLGYKIADIKYDLGSLKTVDTAVEDTFNNMGTSAAKGAKSVGDSISRTLAAFDELNVVESEANGAGGSGIGGVGPGGVGGIGDLEPYVTGYDMLKGLTDELNKKVDIAKENLKKFGKILAGVGVVIGIIKGLKWVNDLIKWAEALKADAAAGKGLAGVVSKTLVPGFKALWEGLKTGKGAIAGMFSSTGELTTSFVSLGAAITGTAAAAFAEGKIIESSYKSYLEGASSIESTTIKVTTATAALGLAAGAIAGPVGVLAVAVGGLVGGTNAIMDYKAQMEQMAKDKAIYESIYDGQGIKVEDLTGKLRGLIDNTSNYLSGLGELKTGYEESRLSMNEAKSALDNFKYSLDAQKDSITNSQLNELSEYYNIYIQSIKDSALASQKYGQEIINSYSKIEGASKETTAQRIADYLEAQKIEEGYSVEYVKRAKEIDLALYKGSITADEAAKKHHELDVEYGLVAETAVNAEGVISRFNDTVADIDYSAMTPEQLEQYFKDLSTSYQNTKTQLETAKTDTETYYDGLIEKYQTYVKNLEETEKKQGFLTDAQKTKLKDYTTLINEYTTQKENAVAGYAQGLEDIETEMKDTLAVIYADLKLQNADVSTQFSGLVDNIKKDLEGLDNVDMSESGRKTLITFMAGAEKQYPYMAATYNQIFTTVGLSGAEAISEAAEKGWVNVERGYDNLHYSISKKTGEFKDANKEIGQAMADGLNEGMSTPAKINEFKQINEQYAVGGQTAFKNANGIHSPSTVYAEFGKNLVLGLSQGISQNQSTVIKSMEDISNSLRNVVSNTTLSFKFSSNVEGSLNTMLTKIRDFANRWKNAINDLLKNMQNSLNSVKLDSKNKVTYTSMSSISIPSFAEGGYPTSGDLFFANENGRAEYITSLGNKTAVTNQDQMVSALTNAILQGMSSIQPQQGITQVYIGNDKVYEGYGVHQSREADRYGTTYVKI